MNVQQLLQTVKALSPEELDELKLGIEVYEAEVEKANEPALIEQIKENIRKRYAKSNTEIVDIRINMNGRRHFPQRQNRRSCVELVNDRMDQIIHVSLNDYNYYEDGWWSGDMIEDALHDLPNWLTFRVFDKNDIDAAERMEAQKGEWV